MGLVRRRWLIVGLSLTTALAGCGTRVDDPEDAASSGSGAAPYANSSQVAPVTVPSGTGAVETSPEPAARAGVSGSVQSGSASRVATPTSRPSGSPQASTGGPAAQSTGGGATTVSDQPGTPVAPTAPKPTDPALPKSSAAGAPIVVGTIGTLTGPVGEVLRSAADGVAVWVKAVNARGGVNGHPVRQVVADDGADPARHRSMVRELVERRGVQAFVLKIEAFAGLTGPDPYIVEHKIPVVGTLLSYEWDYASPLYFPHASSGAEFNIASYFGPASQLFLPKGLKKLGTMTCVESNVCEQANQVWAKKAAEFGFEMVYQGRVSLGQPDFTAECLAARNAGVQLMFFGFDDKSAGRVANSCGRQSFRPQYIHTFQAASPAMLDNPNLDGMIVGTLTFPWVADDTPARHEFREAFARYLPGTAPLGAHASGWVAGKLFEEGEKNLPASFSGPDLLTGLWQIRNNDLGGLTHPLSFFPDRGAERRTCWSSVAVQKGKFVLTGSSQLVCRPQR